MQKTILIVEDNDDLRNFLKKVLTANNFKIAEASDGAQALEAVEKYLPDLVLLDFGLPKVSGETVCVKIKKDHPNIIVIALTEKTGSSDVVHGLQIGADDFISKPFVAEELIARIDTRFKTSVEKQSDLNDKVVIHDSNKGADSRLQEEGKVFLRESIVLIVIRFISLEAIFGLSLFLFSILFSYLSLYTNITFSSSLFFIILAIGFLTNIGIAMLIVSKWNSEYTEVSKDGIVKHSGILNRKEQKYACNFVEVTKVEQSFMGLLFNYGTIELYDPALKEQVFLLNVANPKKCNEIIQSTISKKENKPMPFVV